MKLIINADDFGITEGATRGILTCHQAGLVTSTTLMVTMPAAEFAAREAQNNPGLGVGLHFNLTLGRPACPPAEVPGLVERSGEFMRRRKFELWAGLGALKPLELERELRCQLDRLYELGVKPTHIDSHQHAHSFPVVFDVVAKVAAEKDLAVRLPWRFRHRNGGGGGTMRRFRASVLERLIRRNASRWQAKLRTNRTFGSLFDLPDGGRSHRFERVPELLDGFDEGPAEWMVHPAVVDDELRALTGITEVSVQELDLLQDPRLTELLAARGFELATFSTAFCGAVEASQGTPE